LYEGQFVMAISTTQSIWRSGGGDQTRTAYCGTGAMVAQFYIPDLTAAVTSKVQVSSTNTANVILPINAVITRINIASVTVSGGSSPTMKIGFTTYNGGTNTPTGLANNATDAVQVIDLDNSTKGASIGAVMSSSDLVYITAGVGSSGTAPSSGSASGWIEYFVVDPTGGQQNV
jgi:hypothetical protein